MISENHTTIILDLMNYNMNANTTIVVKNLVFNLRERDMYVFILAKNLINVTMITVNKNSIKYNNY